MMVLGVAASAKGAPSAENLIAAYTFWLMLFTGVLGVATVLLWIATLRTLAHLKREFIATHRPRLRIRNVVVRPSVGAPNTMPMLFSPNEVVRGQLYVVNVGDTPATVTESGCWVEWSMRPLPMERFYEGKPGNGLIGDGLKLEPGGSVPGIFQSERIMGPEGVSLFAGDAAWRLWVMGWVSYVDEKKTPRRTTFCRAYVHGPDFRHDGHFDVVQNADYEHEE